MSIATHHLHSANNKRSEERIVSAQQCVARQKFNIMVAHLSTWTYFAFASHFDFRLRHLHELIEKTFLFYSFLVLLFCLILCFSPQSVRKIFQLRIFFCLATTSTNPKTTHTRNNSQEAKETVLKWNLHEYTHPYWHCTREERDARDVSKFSRSRNTIRLA